MRNIISGGAGVASAVLCYNVAGKGNGRYVSAAACGAGGYFGAKWLLDSSDQKEVDRVQSEYQRRHMQQLKHTSHFPCQQRCNTVLRMQHLLHLR
jgi:hypothetical protein